jgi:hypothetical protein
VRTQFKAPDLELARPCVPAAELPSSKFTLEFPGNGKTLEEQLLQERATAAALAKEIKFVRRMLDDRDRQYVALQVRCGGALRRRGAWRVAGAFRSDLRRLRRSILSVVGI